MDVSRFLAKVTGLYLVIVSIAMLINIDRFFALTTSLVNNEPLMFVSGFFTLILGLCLVVVHNVWQWNWRVIITILCWLALLKGITILLFPQYLSSTTMQMTQNISYIYAAIALDMALGLVLIYFGFKARN